MRPLLIVPALLALAVGCVVIPENQPTRDDDQPIVDRPDDTGTPPTDGWTLDLLSAPPGTDPAGWRWREDLGALGGVLTTEGGRLVGHTVVLDAQGLVSQHRDTYGALDPLVGVPRRLWDEQVPIDWFATGGGETTTLHAWADGARLVESVVDARLGAVDAHLADDGWLDAVACGDGALLAIAFDLEGSSEPITDTLAMDLDRCALLAPGDVRMVIAGSSTGGPLWRWIVSEEGFTDSLRLAEEVAPVHLATASSGEDGWLAVAEPDRILVFSADGVAASLAADRVVALAIDGDGAGGLAVAWAEEDGQVHVAMGPHPDLERTRLGAHGAVDGIAVGLRVEGAAVAVQTGTEWVLARSSR